MVCGMYHPWQHAKSLGLTIAFVPGLRPRGTYRDGHVQIREGLSQRERRCALAHEIVHHERGDDGAACSAWHLRKLERVVHLTAARRLLPLSAILDVQWEPDPAEALWVDDYTLTLRLQHLTPAEQAELGSVAC